MQNKKLITVIMVWLYVLFPLSLDAENPEWMYFHDIKNPDNITVIDNSIYLSTGSTHVIRLNLENLQIDTIAQIFSVSSIAQDKDKNIWCSARFSGIYKYSNGNLENFTSSNSGLPDSRVYDLVIDADNNVWCATRQGLAKFDGSDWEVFHIFLYNCFFISNIIIRFLRKCQ